MAKQTARIIRNNIPLTLLANGLTYAEPLHINSVTDARALPNPPPPFITIGSSDQTIFGSYYWNSSSTASDDGQSVLQLTGVVTGRFLSIFNGFSGTIAATGALIGNSALGGRVVLRGLVGFESTHGAIYLGNITPSASNPAIYSDGSSVFLNGPVGSVQFLTAGVTRGTLSATGFRIGDSSSATAALDVQGNTTIGLAAKTSRHIVLGAQQVTTRSTNTNFTIDTTTTDRICLIDTSSSAVTVTLPVPSDGRLLSIKDKTGNAATHNITIARHGSEKIDGAASNLTISSNFGVVRLTSDGTDWYVI